MAAYNYDPDLWRKLLSGEYYNKNIAPYTKTLSQYYNDIVNNTQQEKTEPALVQNTIDNVYKTGKTIYDANKVNFWSNRASNLMQRADKAKNAFNFTKAANLADRAEKASQKAISISNNTQKGLNTATKASNITSKISGWAGAALTAGSFAADMYLASKSRYNQNNVGLYDQPTTINDLNSFNLQTIDRSGFDPVNRKKAPWVVLDKAASGAAAGAFKGGIGAAIGTAIGTVAGLGQLGLQSQRFDRDMALADQADYISRNVYNTKYNNTISDANNKYNTITNRQLNRHIAANGGFINSNDNMKYAEGGQIENVFNNGGTHEENPYGGIFQGKDQVEQGEVRIGDFIFSARVNADRDILSKFNCAVKRENATYADIAKQILDNFNERNDYISNKTKRILFERLAQAQEYQKVSDEAAKYGMTPEEYTQYQQQLQEQQAAQEQYQQEEVPVDEQQMMMQQPFYEDVEPQQYAFGGRMFANGGNRTEPGKPPYTGNLYEKPKSNWQKLQESLEEQFPELQKHRRDIHDFVKSILSGVDGDMKLAYELTYGGLNDLLFGTSGTNEEFQNAIFAAMPFVGKIKGVGSKAVNAGKKLFNRAPKNLNTKTQWWRTPFGTSQKAAENKFIRKVGRDDSLWSNITKKDIDKLTNKEKQEIIERFEKGDIFKKPYEQFSSAEKQLYDNLETLVSGLKNNPDYFKTTHAKDIWNRTRQIIGSRAVSNSLLAGAIFGIPFTIDKVQEAQERNDAAQNAIRNSINETYGYNNVPTNVTVPDTNSVNTNVYNPPLLFEDPLQTTNNLPQYVAAPDESTAYNPNATLNTNSPTTTKTNPPYRYTENVYGNAYNPSSGNSTRNNYSFPYNVKYNEPGLEDFVTRRGDNDTINAFTDAYNKATGKKYTPAQIVKNLSDHKWKDIHEAFYKFIQPDEDVAAEPNNLGNNLTQNPDVAPEPGINYDDDLKQYYYPIANPESSEEPNDNRKTGLYDAARMIPTLGKLRGILEQEEPDEAYANEILSYYRPTDYNPTGHYKTYSPADQYMLMRQARAQRNALAQQYLANAGGNPAMANYMLAVNDAQYNQDLADNYLKIKQYNDQLRDQALEYNNQLDETNEVRRANTQQANNQLWANLGLPAAAAREQERRDVEEAKYANQESFWNDLATIARERQDRELIRRNPALFYDAWMNYKG